MSDVIVGMLLPSKSQVDGVAMYRDSKEELQAIGVVVIYDTRAGQYYDTLLPKGWTVSPINLLWSEIRDEQDRPRIRFVSDNAPPKQFRYLKIIPLPKEGEKNDPSVQAD